MKNCAWCQEEKAPENTSHGICDEHAEQVLLQFKKEQFEKVPSYVGEREKFEKYIQERKSR